MGTAPVSAVVVTLIVVSVGAVLIMIVAPVGVVCRGAVAARVVDGISTAVHRASRVAGVGRAVTAVSYRNSDSRAVAPTATVDIKSDLGHRVGAAQQVEGQCYD